MAERNAVAAPASRSASGRLERVAVVGVSGNGKTTFSRRLAERLGVRYVEMDAIVHQPGWREAGDEEVRVAVEAIMAESTAWVFDGSYERKLGSLILERADLVVWLDQPLALVMYRLVRRAVRDIVTGRDLFNGNRQTWRAAFFERDSLVSYALKSHFRRRRSWPRAFAQLPGVTLVRLRSPRDVEEWLAAQ